MRDIRKVDYAQHVPRARVQFASRSIQIIYRDSCLTNLTQYIKCEPNRSFIAYQCYMCFVIRFKRDLNRKLIENEINRIVIVQKCLNNKIKIIPMIF